MRTLSLVCFILLFGVSVSHAATPQVRLDACGTVIDALRADWWATQATIRRHGPAAEINPIVRMVGADPYFIVVITTAAGACRETPVWQYVAVGTWLVQTWAVHTHVALGTVVRPPLLQFVVRF